MTCSGDVAKFLGISQNEVETALGEEPTITSQSQARDYFRTLSAGGNGKKISKQRKEAMRIWRHMTRLATQEASTPEDAKMAFYRAPDNSKEKIDAILKWSQIEDGRDGLKEIIHNTPNSATGKKIRQYCIVKITSLHFQKK